MPENVHRTAERIKKTISELKEVLAEIDPGTQIVARGSVSFAELGMTRLISLVQPENVASIRVAEKIGMTCEKEVYMWDLHLLVYVVSRAVA